MLFNSGEFFFFFIAVYLLYTRLNHKWQNVLLLVSSYIFYGAWDVRFLSLIFISTLVDYSTGLIIHEKRLAGDSRSAKWWLVLSVVVNLGILGFFKYFNFFADSLLDLADLFGWHLSVPTLKIILPAGISFYTFQSMSYSLDIYRGHMKPTRKLLDFALFVSFFPQLMAGPIERARRLLPQIEKARILTTEKMAKGGWLILWGVFKKVFIADNLAPYTFWSEIAVMSPTTGDVYLGSIAFAIQFYCDFSGYSDIARGLAAMMGFKLTLNFNLPYFSTNPSVFWGRWHITLTSWLRDYCYAPIARSKGVLGNKSFAMLATMGISGLWHGADWKFIIWGSLWGVAIVVHRQLVPFLTIIKNRGPAWNNALGILGVIFTLQLWIAFGQMFISTDIMSALSKNWIMITDWTISEHTARDLITVLYYSWPLILMQIAQFRSKDLYVIFKVPYPLRLLIFAGLLFLLVTNGAEGGAEFIYFQF